MNEISDEQLLAEFQRRFQPLEKAPYDQKVFELLNGYRPSVNFEVVVWRKAGDSVEVLLRDRTDSEAYPGARHIVGSYMLLGEKATEVVERIVSTEVGATLKISTTACAGILFDRFERRGPQVHIIYVVSLDGEPHNPRLHWVSEEMLGSDTKLLGYHRGFIQDIALPVIKGEHPPVSTTELL